MWLTSDSSLQEGPAGRTAAAMPSQGASSEQLGDMQMVVSTSESAPKTSVHISVTFPGRVSGSEESAQGQAGVKSRPVASLRPQPSPGKPCVLRHGMLPLGRRPLKCMPVCSVAGDHEQNVSGRHCCTSGLVCPAATAPTTRSCLAREAKGSCGVLLLQQHSGPSLQTQAVPLADNQGP